MGQFKSEPNHSGVLAGLTLDAARALLSDANTEIIETLPPLGANSPLRGATDEGALRVLRGRHDGVKWVLVVAREQTRS